MKTITKGNTKPRKSRIAFCEWNSASMGAYNNGGIICAGCNFHRTLQKDENKGVYHLDNSLDRDHQCPKCSGRKWYWLPPIARVPKSGASKRVWKKFWKALKGREFNHPKGGCR